MERRNGRAGALLLSLGLMAGLSTAPSGAQAAPNWETAASSASIPTANSSVTKVQQARASVAEACQNGGTTNGGVSGFAVSDGGQIVGGKIRLFARGPKDPRGTFTQSLEFVGKQRTNRLGGFFVTVACLPRFFLVKVTGGTVFKQPSTQTVTAIGSRGENGVIATDVTTLAAEVSKSTQDSPRSAVKQVTDHLRLVHLGTKLINLGSATWVTSSTFDTHRYFVEAMKHGGVQAFARVEAQGIGSHARHSFKPRHYVMKNRLGYPLARQEGSPRTPRELGPQARSDTSEFAAGLLGSVAGKAAFNAACATLPPTPPVNSACADPDAEIGNEILNQLVGISAQLTELQQSVNDIITMLDSMQQQLNTMQNELITIEQQNNTELQQTLQVQAENAQSAYQQTYSFAGVAQISAIVQEATSDMTILGSIEPEATTTWPQVPLGSSYEQMCNTMYSEYNTSSGQNPVMICADYLTQVNGFAAPSTSYYSVLFKSLSGYTGLPQNDLLIWTLQNMLTNGGNTPVSPATIAAVQSQIGQIEVLGDNAFALLAAGQMFEYGATTGQLTFCNGLTTSGTFPASTSVSVPDACDTLQSALFIASVQNAQAQYIAVPPSGTVADPRTNYVWWGYPLDLSAGTTTSGSYPFVAAAPAGTYNTSYTEGFAQMLNDWAVEEYGPGWWLKSGGQVQMGTYVTNVPQCTDCTAQQTPANEREPLLVNSPSYGFLFANESQASGLLNNMLLTNPTSVAGTLNNQGFVDIGITTNTMSWVNLGVDPGVFEGVYSTTQWNSTTPMATNVKGCTGYPTNARGNMDNYDCGASYWYGQQYLTAVMAQHTIPVNTSLPPSVTGVTTCPENGFANTWDAETGPGHGTYYPTTPIVLCESNTFGLLVDTQAPAPGAAPNGFLPPFFSVGMLDGPPSGGVPAVPVSNVVYSST